ncbi:MAG: FAD-dependent oxidoreductase [Steroidobacteraceae bacterium]
MRRCGLRPAAAARPRGRRHRGAGARRGSGGPACGAPARGAGRARDRARGRASAWAGGCAALIDGLPFELGASEVGGNYGCIIDAAKRHGLGFDSTPRTIGEMSFRIGGQLLDAKSWPAASVNRTVGAERNVLPVALETAYMFRLSPLGDDVAGWLDPKWAKLDVSAGEWLLAQGVSRPAIDLMGIGTNYTDMWSASALGMFRDIARARFGGFRVETNRPQYGAGTFERAGIAGGSQRLPEAMAQALRRPVRFGKAVVQIESGGDGVSVTCLDGSRHRADFAVCALPFSVLQRMDLRPAPPQIEAIAGAVYGGTSHVILKASAPFWEQDDRTIDVQRRAAERNARCAMRRARSATCASGSTAMAPTDSTRCRRASSVPTSSARSSACGRLRAAS